MRSIKAQLAAHQQMQELCGEIGIEDGIDPRELEKQQLRAERLELISASTTPQINRKAMQLCRQVERILSFLLYELGDERLMGAHILSVVPAPHTHHLMAIIQLDETAAEEELAELHILLRQSRGLIRSEIAQSINRRKTPDVSFRVINPSQVTD